MTGPWYYVLLVGYPCVGIMNLWFAFDADTMFVRLFNGFIGFCFAVFTALVIVQHRRAVERERDAREWDWGDY